MESKVFFMPVRLTVSNGAMGGYRTIPDRAIRYANLQFKCSKFIRQVITRDAVTKESRSCNNYHLLGDDSAQG